MKNPGNTLTRRLKISGRVQGVGFRAFVHHHACRMELDGFVRNLTDETVEVLVAGDEVKVDALIALCRKGPPAARVEHIEISDAQEVAGKGFRHLQ